MIDLQSRNARHLRAGWGHAWMVGTALAVGTATYGLSLGHAYDGYVDAYRKADASELLERKQAVWNVGRGAWQIAALKALDLDGLDARQAWSNNEGVWAQTPAKLLRRAAECAQRADPAAKSVLEFAVILAYCARTETLPMKDPERKATNEPDRKRIIGVASQLAVMLAGRPTGVLGGRAQTEISSFQEASDKSFLLVWSNSDGRLSDLEIAKVLADRVLVGTAEDGERGALAKANRSDFNRAAARERATTVTGAQEERDEQSDLEVRILQQAIVKLFALASNSENLQDAREGVVLWKGWIQHALICLGVYIVILSSWRHMAYRTQRKHLKAYASDRASGKDEASVIGYLAKTMEELRSGSDAKEALQELRAVCDREMDSLAYSRTWLTWASRTLVGLGFLGTVLGIMDALSGAGVIVLSESRLQQAAAITDVASLLGLSFATTFIALGINLVVGLWIIAMATAENRLVAEAEEAVIMGARR